MTALTFRPDGTIYGLWTDALPLQDLGTLDVTRASRVEFNAATQQWEVRFAHTPDTAPADFSDASRDTCLTWERETLNNTLT